MPAWRRGGRPEGQPPCFRSLPRYDPAMAPTKTAPMKRQPMHRGFRTPLSEAHAAARLAIGELDPDQRGRLSQAGYCQATHFYGRLGPGLGEVTPHRPKSASS